MLLLSRFQLDFQFHALILISCFNFQSTPPLVMPVLLISHKQSKQFCPLYKQLLQHSLFARTFLYFGFWPWLPCCVMDLTWKLCFLDQALHLKDWICWIGFWIASDDWISILLLCLCSTACLRLSGNTWRTPPVFNNPAHSSAPPLEVSTHHLLTTWFFLCSSSNLVTHHQYNSKPVSICNYLSVCTRRPELTSCHLCLVLPGALYLRGGLPTSPSREPSEPDYVRLKSMKVQSWPYNSGVLSQNKCLFAESFRKACGFLLNISKV